MSPSWETIIAALVVLSGQVVQYLKSKKKTAQVVESAKTAICEDGHDQNAVVMAKLRSLSTQVENLNERLKTMSIAFSAMDSSTKNHQYALTGIAEDLKRQSRVLDDLVSHKRSEKTVIPGGKS